MGREFLKYFESSNVYVCRNCKTHLSTKIQVISKNFNGKFGRCFLIDKMLNINEGPKEEKNLMTGLHVVRDIFCKGCSAYSGWTYVEAYEISEKYKEGKFIMERNQVLKHDWTY